MLAHWPMIAHELASLGVSASTNDDYSLASFGIATVAIFALAIFALAFLVASVLVGLAFAGAHWLAIRLARWGHSDSVSRARRAMAWAIFRYSGPL